MLPRILEPEVMDTASEAAGYNDMDHSTVNAAFADDFRAAMDALGIPQTGRVLDVGTGTGLIPIAMASRLPKMTFVAIDLSEEMLKVGRTNLKQAGLSDRIELRYCDARSLASAGEKFEAVVSNTLVHHIAEPLSVFRSMKAAVAPGGILFIRDLIRPDTHQQREELVERYTAGAPALHQRLLSESLNASLTLQEVRDILKLCGLPVQAVEQTSDRHWTVCVQIAGR